MNHTISEYFHIVHKRASQFYNENIVLIMMVIVYGTMRLFSGFYLHLAFAEYGPGFKFFREMGQYSLAQGFPFLDFWTEYPLAFPWLNLAAYRLSILLPGDQVFWFGTFQRWILIPFDIGGLILIYLIAQELYVTKEKVLRVSLLFMSSFVVLYIPLGWFDAFPLFWLLLTIYFSLKMFPIGSGLAAGVGFLTKPIPFLALPMAWKRFPELKPRLKLTFAAIAGVFIPMLPFILASPLMSLAHLRNLLSRSSWETVWALLDGYRGVGVVAPLSERFDPNSASWAVHSGNAGYEPWLTISAVVLFIYLWTRPIDWKNNTRAVAFVGLTWGIFSLWSKGYSPQWVINFIPFVVLLMPTVRGTLYLLLLTLALVAEWPIAFTLASAQSWYYDAVIVWRTLLGVLLTFEFGTMALTQSPSAHWTRRVYRVVAILMLGVIVFVGARSLSLYTAFQLATEPLQPTILYLQEKAAPETVIICREISVCEHISPYLRGKDIFWLPNTEGWQAERLPEYLNGYQNFWSIEPYHDDTGHDLAVERWLSEQYGKVSQEWVDSTRVTQYVQIDYPDAVPASVRFGETLQLVDVASAISGEYIGLVFNWHNPAKIETNYKLFVHILDEAGQIVAQSDRYPVGDFSPPNEWDDNSYISDFHGLVLPVDTPDQTYSVRVGWYDPQTGERLPVYADDKLLGIDYFGFVLER